MSERRVMSSAGTCCVTAGILGMRPRHGPPRPCRRLPGERPLPCQLLMCSLQQSLRPRLPRTYDSAKGSGFWKFPPHHVAPRGGRRRSGWRAGLWVRPSVPLAAAWSGRGLSEPPSSLWQGRTGPSDLLPAPCGAPFPAHRPRPRPPGLCLVSAAAFPRVPGFPSPWSVLSPEPAGSSSLSGQVRRDRVALW